MKKIIFLVIMLSITTQAKAFNGVWVGSADDYPVTISITKNGSAIAGTYDHPHLANFRPVQISGSVSGKKIIFKRQNGNRLQNYTGYLSRNGKIIAGTYTNGNQCCFPFYMNKR